MHFKIYLIVSPVNKVIIYTIYFLITDKFLKLKVKKKLENALPEMIFISLLGTEMW